MRKPGSGNDFFMAPECIRKTHFYPAENNGLVDGDRFRMVVESRFYFDDGFQDSTVARTLTDSLLFQKVPKI